MKAGYCYYIHFSAIDNDIPIPEPSENEEYNGRISLRIPRSLHRNIIESAKRDGVSANQYLTHLISLGMGQRLRVRKKASK